MVKEVARDSPAGRAGVQPGDVLRRVDGYEINDVVDLRYRASEGRFKVELVRDGMYRTVQFERKWGEELGLSFTFELADQIHTCDNKCVFCFIHQMPKGMRKTLYVMDDDFRLSFLHGNYVTLTNMSEEEFGRTKEQGLSPLYVSVHATDARLRGFMLGRERPEPILPRLRELITAGISVHCQIVLCPGMNDGLSFDKTIGDLAALHPTAGGGKKSSGLTNGAKRTRDIGHESDCVQSDPGSAGVLSVAVVPVGLSKYRHNLYPIRPVTADYARSFLKQVSRWHRELKGRLGTRFVFPSDEWFFLAGRPVPARRWYENFPQFEDGIGTCRVFLDEAKRALERLSINVPWPIHLTLVTGVLPSGLISSLAARLSQVTNLQVDVCVVRNHFFGDGITVAGLLTGEDVMASLKEHRPKGIVALPDIMLKDGDLFLDDVSVSEVRERTCSDVRVCPSRAGEFLRKWLAPNVCAPQ